MRITIPSKLKTLSHLLQLLIRPYHFGFIRGHWYLTTSQIDELSSIVVRQNPENRLVENYERSFSKLIGNGFGKSYAAGRMGFYTLMKILKIGPGDEVILLAFTCSVMANAVWRVGATPIYADIDPETFGSSAPAIEQKISSRTKLIVVQHSFGIPCKIDEIVNLGQRHGIFVLEDCAITVDSLYKGISVGNWGDAAIFSTDHSKPLNTLIGGFLYTRHLNLFNKIKTFSKDLPHLEFGQQKRLFKQILIEKKYCLPRKYPRMRIGQQLCLSSRKILQRIAESQRFTFLEADYNNKMVADAYPYPAKLPPLLALLGIWELERWPHEKKQREHLLKEYMKVIRPTQWGKYVPQSYWNECNQIVPLRFAFSVPNTAVWKQQMKPYIDIDGIWFQEPIIGCLNGPESMGYSWGSCLTAEKTNKNIINWPCVVAEGWPQRLLNIFQEVVSRV